MPNITDETENISHPGSPEEETPAGEPREDTRTERTRRLEAFDESAYETRSQALGALIEILDPQHPKDIERVLELQRVRLDLIEAEMLKQAAEHRSRLDQQKAEEDARDKAGGRGENPCPRPVAPQSPEEAMHFLADLLTYTQGPIHQLTDDAERATHIAGRVSAGTSAARLLSSAASLGLAINRIGGESRTRMIRDSLGRRAAREDADRTPR